MSTLALTLLAVTAVLLALAFWWIRRNHLAVYPVGRGPVRRQPLPTGCDVGALLMAASTDTAPATAPAGGGAPAPAPTRPKRKEPTGPSRREFLRYSLLASWGGVLAAFSAASIAFLWPNLRGGFGSRLEVGALDEILEQIRSERAPFAYPSGRMYLVEYDASIDAEGQYADITGDAPLMALYHRCVHLGCKVPWCQPSQWFECPCHGSRYNRWGEYEFGPAPRGLDRFSLTIEDGRVIVDTSTIVTGPTRTTHALIQPPEGPHCTSA